MTRSYKKSYKTHRNSARFHVTFDAPAQAPNPVTVCEDCGGDIEEVMTVPRCFACESIRRRDPIDHIQTIAQDAGVVAVVLDTAPAQTLAEFQTLAAKYAPKPFTPKPNCEHAHEYATLRGMMCSGCHRVREAVGEFEIALVSKLTPRNNGYINWRLR